MLRAGWRVKPLRIQICAKINFLYLFKLCRFLSFKRVVESLLKDICFATVITSEEENAPICSNMQCQDVGTFAGWFVVASCIVHCMKAPLAFDRSQPKISSVKNIHDKPTCEK
eukprot:6260419-Amphidinium_carterae.1